MYLGNTEIAKAYLGNNLVFQKGSQPSQPIPYIRGGGSGGSYIDTGITADNTVKIIVWARNWNPGSSGLFGSREAAAQNAFFINSPSISSGNVHIGGINVGYGNSNSTYADDQFTNLGGYHKYELYQGVLKIDDVTVATGATSTFSNSLNIHIIGFNSNGTHSTPAFPIDICKVSIWKNNTLVRNLTPVDSPSVGMYDSVSDTVFTNAGSGSLTYGEFNMAGYTPLEYVACVDANSYINTGVYGSNTMDIVAKIRPNSPASAYRWLLGARTSSSSGILEFEIGGNNGADNIYYMNFGTKAAVAENVVYNTGTLSGNDLVWIKTNNVSRLYKDNTLLGTATVTAQTFTTNYTMAIGARNNAGTFGNGFRGRIYYVGFGASGSYVPMLHNGVAGLYEMYSDTFYPSGSGNPFVAGPSL